MYIEPGLALLCDFGVGVVDGCEGVVCLERTEDREVGGLDGVCGA